MQKLPLQSAFIFCRTTALFFSDVFREGLPFWLLNLVSFAASILLAREQSQPTKLSSALVPHEM
jgi:hypothetical protein